MDTRPDLPVESVLAQDLTLVVGRQTGEKTKGWRVTLGDDARDTLEDLAKWTLSSFQSRAPIRYSDDIAFDPENNYLVVPRSSARKLASVPQDADAPITIAAGVLTVLENAATLDLLAAPNLNKQGFSLYSAVFGNIPDERIAFVKKYNPYQVGVNQKYLFQLGQALTRFEDPLFTLAGDFDLIVTPQAVFVLNKDAFEKVFRDIELMKDQISGWVSAALAVLPFDADSRVVLQERAAANSIIAKQLRGLSERGFCSQAYDIEKLREALEDAKLQPDEFIRDNQLHVDKGNLSPLLKLIDERYYTGWHSNTNWEADTRAQR